MPVRVLILRAAGTNCDVETAHAWRLAGAETQTVHVKRLIGKPELLRTFQILTIPGGFSYGDDIAAGTILTTQLNQHVGEELRRFIDDGKLILGICNGFQVLVKTGLLPDPQRGERTVTLAINTSGRFEARWARLRTGKTSCRFLPPETTLELPVAHAEGRLVCRDENVLPQLVANNHAALFYVATGDGSRVGSPPLEGVGHPALYYAATGDRSRISPPSLEGMGHPNGRTCGYPDNPNGSVADIAGLTDPTGQILGLMPHPERFVSPTQHPLWTRRRTEGEPEGLIIFKSALASLGT